MGVEREYQDLMGDPKSPPWGPALSPHVTPWSPEGAEPDELDPVNHPPHYTSHPSGVECIQITEHMGFNLGNAVKYIWRADLKSADPIQDLEKARWYIDREISRRTAAK